MHTMYVRDPDFPSGVARCSVRLETRELINMSLKDNSSQMYLIILVHPNIRTYRKLANKQEICRIDKIAHNVFV